MKILAFNFKMNPSVYGEAERVVGEAVEFAKTAKEKEVIVFPPAVWLRDLCLEFGSAVRFGVQNFFYEEKGAYTGEISLPMVKDIGVSYVIAGHSERRRILGENDSLVNKKVLSSISAGLKTIVCVGEDLETRQKGEKEIEDFIGNQLTRGLTGVKGEIMVAYEPIWAIGTGVPATPEDAVKVIRFIKQTVEGFGLSDTKVLYGGSVDAKNVQGFLERGEIDGVLVGGASLNPKQFVGVI